MGRGTAGSTCRNRQHRCVPGVVGVSDARTPSTSFRPRQAWPEFPVRLGTPAEPAQGARYLPGLVVGVDTEHVASIDAVFVAPRIIGSAQSVPPVGSLSICATTYVEPLTRRDRQGRDSRLSTTPLSTVAARCRRERDERVITLRVAAVTEERRRRRDPRREPGTPATTPEPMEPETSRASSVRFPAGSTRPKLA